MAQKRYQVTLTKETVEELQGLLKKAGLPPSWLSHEIDRMLPGLLAVVKQAMKDSEDRLKMTESQAAARYAAIMSACLIAEENEEKD